MSTQYYFRDDFLKYEELLLSYSKIYTFPKNRDIPIFFDNEHHSIYLLEGQVISKFIYADGKENWKYFFERGSFFPLWTEDVFYPQEQSHSFCTTKKTRFLLIPTHTLRKIMEENPSFAWTALKATQKIVTNLTITSISQLNHTTKNKVCSLLYLITHDEEDEHSVVHLSQEQIACFIGSTQAQVAQVIKSLKREGIIETAPRFIRILDKDKMMLYQDTLRDHYNHV